jgi:hypothetical protein
LIFIGNEEARGALKINEFCVDGVVDGAKVDTSGAERNNAAGFTKNDYPSVFATTAPLESFF